METFYLIRHAHCEAVGRSIAGWTRGIHLSPEGRLQADRLGRLFSGVPVKALCCSPLERARETAEPIARNLGIKAAVSEAWGEIRFGRWTGLDLKDLDGDPGWRRFNTFRSGTRIPEGELMIEVQARAVAEMDRLQSEYPDQAVAVISHGDVIRSVLAYYSGIPLDLIQRFEVSPASVSTLVLNEDGARIMNLNMTVQPDGTE